MKLIKKATGLYLQDPAQDATQTSTGNLQKKIAVPKIKNGGIRANVKKKLTEEQMRLIKYCKQLHNRMNFLFTVSMWAMSCVN